jgi:hypothetical protein
MSVSPYLDVYSVTIANISWNSISVPINIGLSKQTVETLIDSSAGGLFIDQNFAKNFDINYLDKPVKAYNVDGTENKQGTINAYVNLEFFLGERKFKEQFYVTGLGKQRIILGFPWLHKHNPIINWKKGEITFKPFRIDWRCLMEKGKQIQQEQQPKIEEVADDEELKNWTTLPLRENKMGVYIKLLGIQMCGSTRPTLPQSLLLRKIVRKQTKRTNNWYRRNITNTWTFLVKKRHTVSLNRDLGITRLK